MDFSFLGLGLSYSVGGGNNSSSGMEEGKQLLFKDKVLIDKHTGGFSGVFRYALRAGIGNGFPSASPPEALPFTGKTLPEGHDVNPVADRTPANILEFDTDDSLYMEDDSEPSEDLSYGEHLEFLPNSVANPLVQDVNLSVLPETATDQGELAPREVENATGHPFSGKLLREETFPKNHSTNGLAFSETLGHLRDDGIFPVVRDSVAGMKNRWLYKEIPGFIGEKLLPHEGVAANMPGAPIPTPSASKLVFSLHTSGASVGEASSGNRPISSQWGSGEVTVPIVGERTWKGNDDSSISLSVPEKENVKEASSNGQAEWKHTRRNLMESPLPGLQRVQTGQPATTRMGVGTDVAAAVLVGSGGLRIPQPTTGNIPGEGQRGKKLSDSEAGLNVPRDSLSQLQDSRKMQPGLMLEPRAMPTATKNPPDPSVPAGLRGELQDSLTALAAGQVSARGGAISDNSGSSTIPKQVEISIPLGHMAWEQNLARQILQAGKKRLRQLHIKLNPSHLGSLDIKLHVDGDSANIAFSSQHAAVREAVEVSLPRLKEMFAGSGINLGDVDVGGQDTAREGGQGMQGGDSLPDRTYPLESNEEYHGISEKPSRSRGNSAGDQLLDYYA